MTTVHPPLTPRGRVTDTDFELLLDELTADMPAELAWPYSVQTYAAMRRDPSVSAILDGYILQLLRASWQLDGRAVDPGTTKRVAEDMDLPVVGEDVTGAARTRGVSWDDHQRIALSSALTFGHMGFALAADVSSGAARLAVLAERPPQTIHRIHADTVTGEFLGVTQEYASKVKDKPQIPADQMAWYCHKREGVNWAGTSLLRSAWAPWLIKREMILVNATSNRRWGAGVPVMEALPGTTPTEAQMQAAQRMAAAARAGDRAGAASPPGFKLAILGLSGSTPDTLGFLAWLDRQITRAALMPHLELAQGTSGGARALGEAFIDSWTLALESIGAMAASVATRQVAARLVEWNEGESAPVPRVTVSGIGSRREVTADSLDKLLSSGGLQADPALEAWIRREYRLPEREGMALPAPSVQGDTVAAANRPGRARTSRRKEPAPGQLTLAVAATTEPDYGQIQQDWDAARTDLLDQWPDASADLTADLASAAAALVAAGALADLGALTADATLVASVAATLTAGMLPVATAASTLAAAEVAALGLTAPDALDVGVRVDELAAFAAAQIAAGYAQAAGRKALVLAGPDVEATLQAHLDVISAARSGLVADSLGAALTAVQNTGRAAVFSQLTGVEWVADEALDRTTCVNCKAADGTVYTTWADAMAAYPAVGNSACLGGGRCRGQLRIQLSS